MQKSSKFLFTVKHPPKAKSLYFSSEMCQILQFTLIENSNATVYFLQQPVNFAQE